MIYFYKHDTLFQKNINEPKTDGKNVDNKQVRKSTGQKTKQFIKKQTPRSKRAGDDLLILIHKLRNYPSPKLTVFKNGRCRLVEVIPVIIELDEETYEDTSLHNEVTFIIKL